ncbi:hypothetical protein DKM44_03750 [Deinococcus irradiatisoli]|uniref:Bacterial transcriptional activator domain-containing protein n=1 Tax=Deinococcus irradiatisoli TaxID=2202254 RepID=A0A2Z3JHL4_9DEIO|nr:AAA family ATPase [Deinococcus irradiatisoli]AWN22459.1 hypothetical protein DKM44_03750 [Deinococcus irradiatisoli]
MLELKVLGRPQVQVAGAALKLAPKRLALMAYLALEGRRGALPRAELCRVLWSGHEAESARRNLRQELHRLKQTPLSAHLHLTPEHVELLDYRCDALDFAALGAAVPDPARLTAALSLYGGPLLAEVDLPDEGVDEWLRLKRAELHQRFLEWRRVQAAELAQQGDLTGAVEALSALLDAGDEAAYGETMRLQARLGQREAALHTFARLEMALGELNLTPTPEILTLRDRLRALPAAPQAGSLSRPPLIGRDALLLDLETHLTSRGGLVLIEGEPGIGKTAVLDALARRWGLGLRLQGREESAATPFSPISEALRLHLGHLAALPAAWRRELARLLPELEGPEPPLPQRGDEGRARFLAALSAALEHLLGGGLLHLDDLHWFDAASLEVLGLLWRGGGWRAVASARPLERSRNAALDRLLGALTRRGVAEQRTLTPLSETETLQLVRALSSPHGGVRFAQRLFQSTQGHPLFVLETLKALFEAGELREEGGRWHTDFDSATEDYRELPMPGSVRAAVRSRLALLGDAARQLLSSAALLGEAFSLAELEGSTPLSAWAQLDALEAVLGAGLIEPSEMGSRRYRFSHHLVQRALLEDLSAERRRWLHQQLSVTLERLQVPAARLAVHLEGASQLRRAAAAHLQAAGEAQAVYAHREALFHLERAVGCGLDAPAAFEAHLQRAAVYRTLDDKARWEDALRAARAVAAVPAEWRRLELMEAELAFYRGRYEAVLARTQALWNAADATPEQRGWLGLWAGNAHSRTAQLAEAAGWYGRALQAAPAEAHELRGRLLNAWAYACYVRSDLAGGREKAAEAMACFEAAQHRKGQAMVHNTLGSLAYAAGEYAQAAAAYAEAYRHSLDIGDLPSQRLALTNLAGTHLTLGQPGEALEAVNRGLELLEDLPDPYAERLFYEDLFDIYTLRHQPDKALASLERSLALADQHGWADWSAEGRIKKLEVLLSAETGPLLGAEGQALLGDIQARLPALPTALRRSCEEQLARLAGQLGAVTPTSRPPL